MSKANNAPSRRTIGRKDKLDLPQLGLENVPAKVDTGAFTSALHVARMELHEQGEECEVSFALNHSTYKQVDKENVFRFPVLNYKMIKNSSGDGEKRPIIQLDVVLFGERFPAEFSLTDRSRQKNPILLGRKLLNERFNVDTSKTDLSFKSKK